MVLSGINFTISSALSYPKQLEILKRRCFSSPLDKICYQDFSNHQVPRHFEDETRDVIERASLGSHVFVRHFRFTESNFVAVFVKAAANFNRKFDVTSGSH